MSTPNRVKVALLVSAAPSASPATCDRQMSPAGGRRAVNRVHRPPLLQGLQEALLGRWTSGQLYPVQSTFYYLTLPRMLFYKVTPTNKVFVY